MMHELELFVSDVKLMIPQKIAFSHDCYRSAYRDELSAFEYRFCECEKDCLSALMDRWSFRNESSEGFLHTILN